MAFFTMVTNQVAIRGLILPGGKQSPKRCRSTRDFWRLSLRVTTWYLRRVYIMLTMIYIYIWFPNFSIYFGLTKLKGVCSANIHRTNSRRTANCSPSNCRPAKEWYGAVAAITTWWWGGELGQKWVLQPWDFNPNWDLYIYVICLDIYI